MHSISPQECSRIAQDLQIRKVQVENVVQLLQEGNTLPFITRYRKERTGGLPEDLLRQIQLRLNFLRQLHDRKQTILKSIEHQGKLTEELRQAILAADTLRRLEDLYLPYKPKKRTPATTARERGLEPLALAIWHSDPVAGNLEELLPTLVNPEKELKSADDVRAGVSQILAELMAESAEVRAPIRIALWETGKICSTKSEKLAEGQGLDYKDYFQFNESARHIPPHRILALNRGEKEGAVKVHLDFPKQRIGEIALHALAELLLKKAGQTPIPVIPTAAPPAPLAATLPSSPAGESASPHSESQPATTIAPVPESAAPPTPPPAALEPQAASPPSPAEPTVAAAELAAPDLHPTPPEAPPPEAPPPEAPPLVASMQPPAPPALVGEPLDPHSAFRSPHATLFKTVLDDALTRLLLPSLEREIRHELTDEAEAHAVAVFARNLRGLLLQRPLHGKRVLAIDPGFRTGCKVVALDESGALLEHAVIHPFSAPQRKQRDKQSTPPESASSPATPTAPADPPAAPHAADGSVAAHAAVPQQAVPQQAVPQQAAAVVTREAAPVPPVGSPVGEAFPAAPATGTSSASDATPPAPAAPPPETPATSAPVAVPPVDKKAEAKGQLKDLIAKHQLQIVALGNGTGCRETEEIVAELIGSDFPELSYVIVNEAGASVYSVSQVGREEFPTHDATVRSAITIGRRLQDPLSELVKVDPQNIGVGLYQHDMSRRGLKESLDAVVESCVNQVGVDINAATVPLLRHVSGLNPMVARELVDWRKQHGSYTSREQLAQVPGLGQPRWLQAAGFLKISGSSNPLDRTWIHPESYGLAEQVLAEVGSTPSVLDDKNAFTELQAKLVGLNIEETARKLGAGAPTVYDLIEELKKPGHDPREDLPPPIFKKGILRIEDLQAGMELKGTVLNVVDFGAFVDIGLKESGLVHISQLANRYIRSPYEVVAVNDVVTLWVLTVDKERRRVSLTMIPPGTDRTPPERRPRREERGRAPHGHRHEGPPREHAQAGQGTPAGEPARHGGPPGEGRGPRPPRGRHHGRGHGRPPQQTAPAPAGADAAPAGEQRPGPPQARPPLPPRRPRREPPKPKLTQAALEGKVPLRTFGELSALFAAKKEKPAVPQPPAETPPSSATSEPPPPAPAEAAAVPPAETPAPAPETVPPVEHPQ